MQELPESQPEIRSLQLSASSGAEAAVLTSTIVGTNSGGTPVFNYTSTYSGKAIVFVSCSAYFSVMNNTAPTFTINGMGQSPFSSNSLATEGAKMGTVCNSYLVTLESGDSLAFKSTQTCDGTEYNSKILEVTIYKLS